MAFDAKKAAQFIDEAHRNRAVYENLPEGIGPTSVDEAYQVQEALMDLWIPKKGRIAGRKIATTTKVMQALMGIDHPCGGMIYETCVHRSPATIRTGDFVQVMLECELAVRLGASLPAKGTPYTRDEVRGAVAAVMPAFELIEDRKAVYKETRALSLIADNAWNGGIVIGKEVAPPAGSMDAIAGRLLIGGGATVEGKTDDPMGALAWVANLAADRKRPLEAGMMVITGSVLATQPVAAGRTYTFSLDGLGSVEMQTTV